MKRLPRRWKIWTKVGRGAWCNVHDDWFPKGCGKCRDLFSHEPTKKELTEYELRYSEIKKKTEANQYKKIGPRYELYFDRERRDRDDTIAKWWDKMKDVRWNIREIYNAPLYRGTKRYKE
jgi:hypothetical protein